MRYLGTIIRIALMAMHRSGHDRSSRRTVARKFVRDDLSGRATLTFHQFLEETDCSLLVLAFLHQDIENIPVLIYRTPQLSPFTSNRYDVNIIQLPCVAQRASTFLERSSVRWAEFVAPAADGFVGNNNSTLSQKILNIAEAKTEPMI